MLSTKRRPTSSLKHSSKSRLEAPSVLSHKRMPTPHDLIIKKYYLPVRQEDERHRAFQISRFIAGNIEPIQVFIMVIAWAFLSCKDRIVNRSGSSNIKLNLTKNCSKQYMITFTVRKAKKTPLVNVLFISMGSLFIYYWKITER